METRPTTRRRRTISVVFLLILSLLASPASTVPLSRSLKSIDVAPRVIPDLSAQSGVSSGFERHEEEGRGRKLRVITDDYGGTGANNKHDPSTGSR